MKHDEKEQQDAPKPPADQRLQQFLEREGLVLDARVQTVQVADGSIIVRAVVMVKEK